MNERDCEFTNNWLEESRTELDLDQLEAVSGGADSLSDLQQQVATICKILDIIREMNMTLIKNTR
jgi:hypothetical protein